MADLTVSAAVDTMMQAADAAGIITAIGAVPLNGALGTPSGGTATNLSGTAAGLTAGTVTTNANLTGPVTSVGNATAIADAALSIAKTSGLQSAIDLKAPLASPTFTGTPAAPTAAVDTNTTQVATAAFVVAQAASANPVMNGAVAVGTSLRYARADHVHATDTALLLLAGGTMTGALVNALGTIATDIKNVSLTATWNAAGVSFTSFKVNVTNTASADAVHPSTLGSLLADFQIDGVSKGVVTKGGLILAATGNGSATQGGFAFVGDSGTGFFRNVSNEIGYCSSGTNYVQFGRSTDLILGLKNDIVFGWSSNTPSTTSLDVCLVRDAANVFAQKNSTTAQEFRVYGTTTGPKYATMKHDGTDMVFGVSGGGTINLTGVTASVDVGAVSTHSIAIKVGGTTYNLMART